MTAIKLVDVTLRDGMHTVAHSFVPHRVATVAAAIDGAGVDVLEMSHGDGLGGSSIQYGIAAAGDLQLVEAAVASVTRTRVAVLLLPGIGTLELLKQAHTAGPPRSRALQRTAPRPTSRNNTSSGRATTA